VFIFFGNRYKFLWMPSFLFVYGSLRMGQPNHGYLAGCRFMGNAKTTAAYRVEDLGAFVGMMAGSEEVDGEVWEVSASVLAKLDYLEATEAGVFHRAIVYLQSPFVDETVQAYFYSFEPDSSC
jgi:gamma-glutamylcyclotransferase (GGCT)/AIG2-like uncharacterized protein YtfP